MRANTKCTSCSLAVLPRPRGESARVCLLRCKCTISLDLENHHPHQPRTETVSLPSPLGEGRETRRSILTIGVRSLTMQAWIAEMLSFTQTIDLKTHHPISQEQKPTPCPLHLERGKRTRRSIVAIGVRSLTMQAWDKSWTRRDISPSVWTGRFDLFITSPPILFLSLLIYEDLLLACIRKKSTIQTLNKTCA